MSASLPIVWPDDDAADDDAADDDAARRRRFEAPVLGGDNNDDADALGPGLGRASGDRFSEPVGWAAAPRSARKKRNVHPVDCATANSTCGDYRATCLNLRSAVLDN